MGFKATTSAYIRILYPAALQAPVDFFLRGQLDGVNYGLQLPEILGCSAEVWA